MRHSRIVVSSACALLVASVAMAQQQPQRTVIEVNRQKVLPGHAAQYEAARKKHMEWHKQAGDAWTWNIWEVVTGPETGSFLVTTGGHQWADFDAWTAKNGAGDTADANASVGQHVASNERSYWTTQPDMSLMPPNDDLPPMGTLTTFYIKPGMNDQFVAAVTKINQALSKSSWPLYGIWYRLSNGGEPAFAVFTPRKGMTDMQTPSPTMAERVEKQLGKAEADAMWKSLSDSYSHSRTEMIELRRDLGYQPAK